MLFVLVINSMELKVNREAAVTFRHYVFTYIHPRTDIMLSQVHTLVEFLQNLAQCHTLYKFIASLAMYIGYGSAKLCVYNLFRTLHQKVQC